MNFIHGMLDIAGGVMLVWLCVRELKRILSEPPERPIDVWNKRHKPQPGDIIPGIANVEERA